MVLHDMHVCVGYPCLDMLEGIILQRRSRVPPPTKFFTISFNGIVRGAIDGANYTTQDLCSNLLATIISRLFKPSILVTEFRATWQALPVLDVSYKQRGSMSRKTLPLSLTGSRMRQSSWRPIHFFVIFGDSSETALLRCLFITFS